MKVLKIKNKNKDLKYIAKNMLKVAEEQEKKTEEFQELVEQIEHVKDTMANLASLGILTVVLVMKQNSIPVCRLLTYPT